jgi:hypothetical protein
MYSVRPIGAACAIAIVSALSFTPIAAEEAGPKPQAYKVVAVEAPQPVKDPTFAAFRKEIAEVAKRKDRAALAKHVAASFFWIGDDGKEFTQKERSGIDNLVRALYLDNADTEGWEILAGFAQEASADPLPERKGVICAPGEPKYDGAAVMELGETTGTTSAFWFYPAKAGLDVRSGPDQDSKVVGKLGMHLVWVHPDDSPAAAVHTETVRIVLPSGQFGYVAADALVPLPGDLLCYVKEGNAWRLGGYIGGLAPAD